jgi:cytochrome c biogenesis protein CcdA
MVAFKTFIMTFIYLILLVIFFLCLELLYSFLFKKIEIFLFRRTKRKVEKLKEKQENI